MKMSLVSTVIVCSLISFVGSESYALEFSSDNLQDQSKDLQKTINKLSLKGGGVIHIKKGAYTLGQINLRSNVHLKIAKGTIITPSFANLKPWKSNTIFNLGRKNKAIHNVSIEGDGGNFVVKFSAYKPGIKVASILNVSDFVISNIDVYDSNTKFSSLSFNASGPDKAHRIVPKHGIIKNISNYNSAYGYGAVQIQGGYDLTFENIYSQGGVALRAETGYKKNNDNQTGGVDKIVGHNIRCENGSAAVMFSPHTIINGTMQVDSIQAKNCGFAVRIEKGFIAKKYTNPNLKIGSFAKGSFVKNIKATYGKTSQLKPKNFQYIPDEYLHLISTKRNPDQESYTGPSIAGVKNSANYKVIIQNLKTYEFPYNKPIVLYKKTNFKKYKKWRW